MKKIILQLCISIGLVVAASATGFSQVSQSYRAHIPFDFYVKNAQMKAGDYRIRTLSSTTNIGALQLLSVNDNKSRILGTVKAESSDWGTNENKGKLVFIRDGDQYSLASIETATYQLRMPRVTASARVLAKKAPAAETTTVALQ